MPVEMAVPPLAIEPMPPAICAPNIFDNPQLTSEVTANPIKKVLIAKFPEGSYLLTGSFQGTLLLALS